jgi:hypothetical protein
MRNQPLAHWRGRYTRLFGVLVMACAGAPALAQSPVPLVTGPANASAPYSRPSAPATDRERITATLSQLPIRFEPLDTKGTFLARGIGPAVRLTGTSIDFPIGSGSPRGGSIRVQFVGARQSSRVTGIDALPGRVNYLLGDDPARWRTNVSTYARAHTKELYRGIDIDYYGAGDLLEYDLIVRPGFRADVIRLAISGTSSVAISEAGDLVYGADERVLLRKPIAYQTINGSRREATVDYRRRSDGTLGFAIGSYDRRHSLVIDPIVAYSFTFGGSSYDAGADIAVDDIGAVYVGGTTYSADFPTVNPAGPRQDAGDVVCWGGQESYTSCSDGFLAKLRPDGAALEYATYFGDGGFDTVQRVAVDASHALYFAGNSSTPIPGSPSVTSSFIGKLAPDGSRFLYKLSTPRSMYVSFSINDLAIGPDGSAYVATSDGVAALSPTGDNYHSILTLPTGPSGSHPTWLYAIAVGAGSVFVAGYTSSAGFPTTPGAAQTQFGGTRDGVIMRLTSDGGVVYSTFLGGSGDDLITDLSVDSDGAVYTAGTTSSSDFPMGRSETPWDPSSPQRVVLAKLTPDGTSISYATLLPYPSDYTRSFPPARVAVDGDGDAYTAACVYRPDSVTGSSVLNCQSWKLGVTGAQLRSSSDVLSTVFAVDAAGVQWFGETTGEYPQLQVTIIKLVPGVALASVTSSTPSPARFATPITWTAHVVADDDVEYSFWRYSTASGWIEGQPFGPAPTYMWTPASWDVGDHMLCVFARLVGSATGPTSCVEFTVMGVAAGEPPVLTPAADFNADRRPDLIWVNNATGELAAWQMGGGAHGEQLLGGGYLNAPALPSGWRVAGAGDVDGDGHSDLFLQSDSGMLGVWVFDGLTLRYGITLTPGQVDPLWQIRAVGDLNHDGHPDLVWQYAPTGQVAFWLMNGTSAIGYVVPDVMAPGGDWEIVGTGDSNRDGERDLFWQQRSTGTLAVWRMHGTDVNAGLMLSASPDARWHVVSVSDLDGDAFSDVVFQHADTGDLAAWYLSDATVRFGAMLNPASAGALSWKIVGPR